MLELKKKLADEYSRILATSQEFKIIWQSNHGNYSGLFLAGVPDNYAAARDKIFVIGRETKGWGKQFNESNTLAEYINIQTSLSRERLAYRQTKLKKDRGSTFHNFMKEITKQCDRSAVVWANLHCYDWNTGRCDKSPLAKEVGILSHELLKAQIEILRPNYIILAHGVAKHSIIQRKKLFPLDACIDVFDPDLKVAGNKQLWKFNFTWAPDYQITGFRIQHPSSVSQASRVARKYLIDHLKNQPADRLN